jgi:hypothetical protein
VAVRSKWVVILAAKADKAAVVMVHPIMQAQMEQQVQQTQAVAAVAAAMTAGLAAMDLQAVQV